MNFAGDLSNVKLPNLIQLVESGGLTGKIAVSQESKKALVCFEKGQIVHVENEDKKGRDALMELFLWESGKFSFLEDDLQGVSRSLDPTNEVYRIEALVRDGMRYADQKAYLHEHDVRDNTVLKRKSDPETASEPDMRALLGILDGRMPLARALESADLRGSRAIDTVYKLLNQGLVEAQGQATATKTESISLPDWVTARLKQDNPDLSRAIVDMVIWVDRVKCWMYQADADLDLVRKQLATSRGKSDSDQSTGES